MENTDEHSDDNALLTLSLEQRIEFDRRLDALEANPNDSLTWDQMLERIGNDLGRSDG